MAPAIRAGRRVLVVAHGNSLRGLVKHLEGISDEVRRSTSHDITSHPAVACRAGHPSIPLTPSPPAMCTSHTLSHPQAIMGVELPVGTPLVYQLEVRGECVGI